MINLLASLTMARKALQAQQAAIQTTGHNIANANTPGFTRQRVDLAPTTPFALVSGSSLGTGVDIKGVTRLRDLLLDSQFRDAHQALGQQQAEEAILSQVESLIGEPAPGGLGPGIAVLFASFGDLANHPTDLSVRTVLRDKGLSLASLFHRLSAGLDSLKADLNTQIQQVVGDVNRLAQQVADLNTRIQVAEAGGGSANDLRDQRDVALNDLSKRVGASSIETSDGQVRVTVGGGLTLVDGQTSAPIVYGLNSPTDSVALTVSGLALTPRGGTLAGLLNARNATNGFIKGAQSQLDTLAKNLILEINRLHASGIGLQGLTTLTSENAVTSPTAALNAAGLPFTPVDGSFKVFVYNSAGVVTASGTVAVTAGTTTLSSLAAAINTVGGGGGLTATVGADNKLTVTAPAGGTFTLAADTSDTLVALGLHGFFSGSDARTIAVSNLVQADARTIAAATPDSTSGAFSQGDNSNALALAQLQSKNISSLSNSTVSGFLSSFIADLGAQSASAKQSLALRSSTTDFLASRREQVSGVSLDEEMTDLIRFQRAYEAAAHFTSVVNDLLGSLIQQLGR